MCTTVVPDNPENLGCGLECDDGLPVSENGDIMRN